MNGKKINLWPLDRMNTTLWTFLLVILIIFLLAVIIWIMIAPINPVEESIYELENHLKML